jgi:acyl-coenzyme A thioesterase PaaI-like protein
VVESPAGPPYDAVSRFPNVSTTPLPNVPKEFAVDVDGGLAPLPAVEAGPRRRTFAAPKESWAGRVWNRIERRLSRLSVKNSFWHRAFSMVYLPFAFRSGISIKRLGKDRFAAVLPFSRFNRNWYNAMAGAALLGNSEVAGGLYLFAECGADYTVVCKEMRYKFLRPCLGPAIYRVVKSEDIKAKLAEGGEFNADLEMEIRQQLKKRGKELLVGRCDITFHCTPKDQVRARAERRAKRSTPKG